MSKEQETSDFASVGSAPFPPIHEDNKVVAEFSNLDHWPSPKLMGRLAMYLSFLERDDPMPRAKDTANRIVDHLIFELSYREGIYDTRGVGDEQGTTSIL